MPIGDLEGGVRGVLPQDQVEPLDDLAGSVAEHWMDLSLHVAQILLHLLEGVDLHCGLTHAAVLLGKGEVVLELGYRIEFLTQRILPISREPLPLVVMDAHDVLSKLLVPLGVGLVHQKENEIESGENGIGYLGVVLEALGLIVAPIDWVGRRQHPHPALQLADHPRLGDGDSLLLHRLEKR